MRLDTLPHGKFAFETEDPLATSQGRGEFGKPAYQQGVSCLGVRA